MNRLASVRYEGAAVCKLRRAGRLAQQRPQSLKSQLDAAVGHEAHVEVQNEWITSGRVEPARIDMPSFNVFREDLRHVVESVVE